MPRTRRRRKRRFSLEEIPTASFSDIAFLLIIFFILVTTLQKQLGFRMEMPAGEESKSQQQKQTTVALRDGRVYFNEDEVNADELAARLHRLELAKAVEKDRIVAIESTGAVPYQQFFETTRAIQEAGGVPTLVKEES